MAKAMNNVKTYAEKRWIYNPVQKDAATFLETSKETGGERTLIEIEAAPGGGTIPHYHKTYAEHFEVLRGVLEVRVGDDTHTLMPGHKAVAPINTLHHWHNATEEPVVFLVELRPGHSGFEKALTVAYGLAGDGLIRKRSPEEPLPHGVVVRVGRGTIVWHLRPPRTVVRAAGKAGQKEGHRQGVGSQVLRLGPRITDGDSGEPGRAYE